MYLKKQRLLTPGPTPLLPQALHAMMGSDIHHRTEDFRKLYLRVLADLKAVFGTSNDVLILVSSGTGALEASITNFLSPGDRVVVCSAGKFGERWVELATAFGLDPVVLKAEYGDVVAPERVEAALREHPDTRAVMVQASETSTGAAHDVRSMGQIVGRTEALFLVDAITGLGTMPLDIDGWGLDVCVGGSQKAFMIPPGLAFLSVSEKAWRAGERSKLPKVYFDLRRERKNAAKGESTWTPNTSLVIALGEALKYILGIGMDQLIENAQMLARATRAAAGALGLELFAAHSPSSAVTAIRSPRGMNSGVIVKEFRERFGSIIANGQAEMKGQIFRIAHLGYFDVSDLFAMVAQLEIILTANGFPVNYGTGVAAVQNIYAGATLAKEPVSV
jgi:aspartate aminotransferase-like enzyme